MPERLYVMFVNGRENVEPLEPAEVEQRTQTPLPQASSSMDCQPELVNGRKNITETDQNKTPPNPIPTPFDRESPNILIDPEVL
ncbi:hypothetical protein JTB14_004527 [Gonioctena quinquepunctata]|nr:hypothetical protein JTB14_004527 [Gonioctena quinquepunctata]